MRDKHTHTLDSRSEKMFFGVDKTVSAENVFEAGEERSWENKILENYGLDKILMKECKSGETDRAIE